MKKTESPFAFISYSRLDTDVVVDIFKRVEKYPYPKKWVEEENRPEDDTFVRPIFLNMADLSIQHRDFTVEIRERLRSSRYLIVFCSDNSAKSDYVKREIDYFLKTHNNDSNLIVAVYIDKVFQGMHPVIDTIVATRNCPIYTTGKGVAGDTGRKYCFYHIVEFLLKVDFDKLYNRYEQHKRRKRRTKVTLISLFVGLITCTAIYGWLSERERAKIEHARVDFEMGVFPYSLVSGYINNFVRPTMMALNDSCTEAPHMIIYMPYDSLELNDSVRSAKYTNYIRSHYPFEGYETENIHIPTRYRASSITKIKFTDYDMPIYKDDARTVTAFRSVIEYKLSDKNPVDVPREIKEKFTQTYADSFVVFAERELPDYQGQVHYVKDTTELGHILDSLLKLKAEN